MDDNRRKKPRVPVKLAVNLVVADGDPGAAELMNVSEGGFFMKTSHALSTGATARICFVTRPEHALCEASGKVVWKGDFGVGVELETASDGFLAFMKELEIAALNPRRKSEHLERILSAPDVEID